jgi:O-acetyl-ADP-ribose deacetylase (regulator of RNase III)
MISLIKGNIAEQEVTFIVNAANEELLWEDKTVNGMIHLGGGPELTKACEDWVKKYGKVKTSHWAVTFGFNLPCDYVIHTVGPVYPCNPNAERELENTYENVLSAAVAPTFLHSIAIPAISTGVFRYPFADATEIQVRTAKRYVDRFSEIRLVYYTDQDLSVARSIYEDCTYD